MTASPTMSSLRKTVEEQTEELGRARESIAKLELAIEDRGWTRIGNQHSTDGLSIDSLQTASEDLRGWIVGGGILKRIIELRGNYFYGDGVGFKGHTDKSTKAFSSDNNVAKVFSVDALLEINRAHGTDGTVVFLVHKSSKEIIRVPFKQLGAPFVDADDDERIWYIRRTYTRKTAAKPEGEEVDTFYRTPSLPASQVGVKRVQVAAGQSIAVDPNYTAVVWKVNSQTGWPLGIPDLFASLQWAEKYTGYLKNQDRFAEALASIAWEYKGKTTDQAKKMAAAIRKPGVAETSVGVDGMEIKAMDGNSAVSFTNGSPLAGQAAAAAEVPLDSVLAESSTDKGGNLDTDLVRVVNSRRKSADAFFKALGRLMDAPKLEVIWPDLTSETPFREAQMIVAAWGTGNFSSEEVRPALAEKLKIAIEPDSKAPAGVLIPNNVNTLIATAEANASATPDPAAADPAGGGTNNSQGNDELGVGKLSNGDNTARDKGEVPA